jgi:hypothetical protein
MNDTPTQPEVLPPQPEPEEEKFLVRGVFIEALMRREFERGYSEATADCRSIKLGEDYGTSSAVVVIEAVSRRALTRAVDALRWRREGDNPGQAYCGTAKLLHRRQIGSHWQGVVLVTTHYDV